MHICEGRWSHILLPREVVKGIYGLGENGLLMLFKNVLSNEEKKGCFRVEKQGED